MSINVDWHKANKMPKNPTQEQRAIWHIQHASFCNCHPVSGKIQALMDKYKKPRQ